MMFTFLVQPLDPNYPLRPELCQTKYKLIGHKCSLQFKKEFYLHFRENNSYI